MALSTFPNGQYFFNNNKSEKIMFILKMASVINGTSVAAKVVLKMSVCFCTAVICMRDVNLCRTRSQQSLPTAVICIVLATDDTRELFLIIWKVNIFLCSCSVLADSMVIHFFEKVTFSP